ncbi:MAG TPA: polyphosphate polymerase domain-containing protein [Verrucomicrobiae bacterium]|nr:polyphosphate polymerase domain-containing protein [Verrucomicrobiae bacterium]
MRTDKMQLQRFEIKYLVPESVAFAARDFIRSYLVPDEFSLGRPDYSYPVHSLYLDSRPLKFYRQTVNGDKNRYKLRVRFYDDELDSPVFLETKRRMNNVIIKQRCAVRRDAIATILAGQNPGSEFVMSTLPGELFAMESFMERMLVERAVPVAHVAYKREAWMSPRNNSVRVTLDRSVRFSPQPLPRLSTFMEKPLSVFRPEVILELKFTDRFPNWFTELVRVFNLRQDSAAKYAMGIMTYGEERILEAQNRIMTEVA